MHIVAILTPKPSATPADFGPLTVPEEKAVWEHYTAGNIREMHFQPEPPRVMFGFEAPDKPTVDGWLADFPMVAAGLFDIDLIAAGPWLPIAALFAKPD